jgi:lysosomal acid phosphatase
MKLIFAADIVRHGDRSSIYYIPEISAAWKSEDMGKLTLKGEKDAIKSGEEFNQYFIATNSLLPYSFQPDTIYIRSTDFQRTKETARRIMRGIYPSQSETIPINTVPREEDLLLLGFLYAYGKEMKSLTRSRHCYVPKASKQIIKEVDLELKKINNKFGTNLNESSDIVKVADVIRVAKIHDRALLKKMSDEEVEQVFRVAKLLFLDIFKSPQAACAGAGALLKQILEKMDGKIRNEVSFKYMLFSGHDTNLLCMMSLLGLSLEEVPYLSNIRFELFKQDAAKFFVKISYLNKTAKIYSEEYCLFYKFKSFVDYRLKKKCEAVLK